MASVHVLDHVQFVTLLFRTQPFVDEILNRLVFDLVHLHAGVADRGALKRARKERGTEVFGSTVGQRRLDRDVAGQVLILCSEAVDGPSAHARPDEGGTPGEGLQERRAMVDAFAHQRLDDAKVIDAGSNMREEIADRNAALAARTELPRRLHQRPRCFIRKRQRALDRQRFTVIADEPFFKVERVDAGRPAVHKEKNDFLRPRRKMRFTREKRVRVGRRGLCHHLQKTEIADAATGGAQSSATRQGLHALRKELLNRVFLHLVHGSTSNRCT